MYERINFNTGDRLKASDLNKLQDNIEEIHEALEGNPDVSGLFSNMEKGTGYDEDDPNKKITSTQQIARSGRIHDINGVPHFSLTAETAEKYGNAEVPFGAIGHCSASLNGRSSAQNKHATAIGNSTIAKGEESFAQGYETIAEGNGSFAAGSNTHAKGKVSTTLGIRTVAEGDYSLAAGVKTIAAYPYQTVIGVGNDNDKESLFEVGNAELEEDGSIKIKYDENGNPTSGRSTAFRVMRDGRVKSKNTWVEEDDDVVNLGFFKYHLLNEKGLIFNENGVLAKLTKGFAEELDKISSPYQMDGCTASADYSAAFGARTSATNTAAFATGVDSEASGAHSCAMGTGVKATYPYKTVIGKYNNYQNNTLFEIGSGENDNNRQNVFEVYNSGDIKIRHNGSMYSLKDILNYISSALSLINSKLDSNFDTYDVNENLNKPDDSKIMTLNCFDCYTPRPEED